MKNLKYKCEECGFIWITLNGEHKICPQCHTTSIQYITEIKDLDIDKVLSYNKSKGGCCGSARGKGPLTCGKDAPDHTHLTQAHNKKRCCGHIK
ncbi:MAG: DNA-binding protein [Methanobacteriaceae archaeon]|nr:DNA-binding protein [Methanobacteriaceae archaeon]